MASPGSAAILDTGFLSSLDLEAARVCRDLQDLINDKKWPGDFPAVVLSVCDGWTSIEVNDFVVFDTQVDSYPEDLTVDFCFGSFLNQVKSMFPVK